jgi:hypothetical protein
MVVDRPAGEPRPRRDLHRPGAAGGRHARRQMRPAGRVFQDRARVGRASGHRCPPLGEGGERTLDRADIVQAPEAPAPGLARAGQIAQSGQVHGAALPVGVTAQPASGTSGGSSKKGAACRILFSIFCT